MPTVILFPRILFFDEILFGKTTGCRITKARTANDHNRLLQSP